MTAGFYIRYVSLPPPVIQFLCFLGIRLGANDCTLNWSYCCKARLSATLLQLCSWLHGHIWNSRTWRSSISCLLIYLELLLKISHTKDGQAQGTPQYDCLLYRICDVNVIMFFFDIIDTLVSLVLVGLAVWYKNCHAVETHGLHATSVDGANKLCDRLIKSEMCSVQPVSLLRNIITT